MLGLFVASAGKKYINISGNNGMATAGSGDVLTGIIAGLMAQKVSFYEAACLGVYIHGSSRRLWQQKKPVIIH